VSIAIENHSNNLINLPDSLRWMLEFSRGLPLGVALAPYHLPQDPALLAGLIRDLGDRLLLFYAWEYGKGCMKPMPLEEELMQLPGRGPLDYAPLLGRCGTSVLPAGQRSSCTPRRAAGPSWRPRRWSPLKSTARAATSRRS
jgi:hypothetical protein